MKKKLKLTMGIVACGIIFLNLVFGSAVFAEDELPPWLDGYSMKYDDFKILD